MTDPIDACLHTLLGRFRRQRPLRSGSLLITILGDAIAPRGGRATLASLIRLAEPFGLPERLVRTSVARLAQDGWLVARRSGRTSEYALTEHGRRRFAAATRRIYGVRPRFWHRRWTLIMLPLPSSTAGARREQLRAELHWLGFGQFALDVFGHPSFSSASVHARLAEAGIENHVTVLEAKSGHSRDDRRLVRSGWDLAELASAYRRFVAAFTPLSTALGTGDLTPKVAFVARTLLIHEYRKIYLRDPLLPDALLPRTWVGTAAYELCRELYRALFRSAERHLTLHAENLAGALPATSRAARGRFAR